MKPYIYSVGLALISASLTGVRAQDHAFAVKDDIEMVRFSDPSALEKDAVAKFSPDGKYFVVVTSKAIIKSNQIESTLSLFRADERDAFVTASAPATVPQPHTTITMKAVPTTEQSDAYGAVITNIRWSVNSRDLYFLADGQHGDRRLYRLSVDRAKPIALTPEGYNVVRFDFTRDEVVYSASRSDGEGDTLGGREDDRINADARAVTGESIESILFPHSQPAPTSRELWIVRNDHVHPVAAPVALPPQRDINWLPEAFSIAPKGHMMVHLRPVTDLPTGWSRYETEKGAEFYRLKSFDPGVMAASNLLRLKEYSLVNLNDGTNVAL